MCRYTLIRSDKTIPCEASQTLARFQPSRSRKKIQLDCGRLPLDENGLCIFHSRNIEWKLANDFHLWLDLYFSVAEQVSKGQIVIPGQTFAAVNMGGFYMIGARVSKAGGQTDRVLKLRKLVFRKPVELYLNESVFADPVFFEECRFTQAELMLNKALFKQSLSFSNCSFYQVALNDARIAGSLSVNNCAFSRYAEFCGMEVSGDARFAGDRFETDALFNEWHLAGSLLHMSCTFLGKADFSGSIFEEDTTFEDCTFSQMLSFNNTRFSGPLEFTTNEFFDNVNFLSSDSDNTMFYDSVQFLFIDDPDEAMEGRLNFEHVNFSSLTKGSREAILDLARQDKAFIGPGCIKYRVQTPIIKIALTSRSHNLVRELAGAFTHYFQMEEGLNLGVEIVARDLHSISLLYYSDENLTLNALLERIGANERKFWDFDVKDYKGDSEEKLIQLIDAYVSKLSVLGKIRLLMSNNLWMDIDTTRLLHTIALGNPSATALQINFFLESLSLSGNMKIENIHGKQINIADTIKRIEYRQNSFSFSKDEFALVKEVLLKLHDSEKTELSQDLEAMNRDRDNFTLSTRLKMKFDELSAKYGSPLAQSIGASALYDILKAVFLSN